MANEVLRTNDYSIFKLLNGNREIGERSQQIIQSIKKIGWVSCPIIVNENMEIIDGQSRYFALKELAMPVEYIVIDGLRLKDCRALNTYNKSWGRQDFIYSYATEGNENYIRVKNLADIFDVKDVKIIINACGSSDSYGQIKTGELKISQEKYETGFRHLSFYTKFRQIMPRFGGRRATKASALFYISDYKDVDSERLYAILENCDPKTIYVDSVAHTLESIQRVYNYNVKNRNKRVHFYEDYLKEGRR